MDSGITLKFSKWNGNKKKFDKPILIHNVSLQVLLRKFIGYFGVNKIRRYQNEWLHLYWIKDKILYRLTRCGYDSDNTIKYDYDIRNNDIIYGVIVTSLHLENPKALKYLENMCSIYTIKYNDLGSKVYNNSVNINIKTTTVGELRKILCGKCKCNTKELIIQNCWDSNRLKDDRKTLKQYNIKHNGCLYIWKGKRLRWYEWIVQIFVQYDLLNWILVNGYCKHGCNVYIPNVCVDIIYKYYNIEGLQCKLNYIGDIILNEKHKITKIKEIIYNKYKSKVPMLKYMRLRDINDNTLTQIYYDNKTLKQNMLKMNDYHQICCQKSETPNERITSKEILINICEYITSLNKIGLINEVTIPSKYNYSWYNSSKINIIIEKHRNVKSNEIETTLVRRSELTSDGIEFGINIIDKFNWKRHVGIELMNGDIVLYRKKKS